MAQEIPAAVGKEQALEVLMDFVIQLCLDYQETTGHSLLTFKEKADVPPGWLMMSRIEKGGAQHFVFEYITTASEKAAN